MGVSVGRLINATLLTIALLPFGSLAAIDQSPDLPDPIVHINDQDGTLQLNISFRVPVSPREAWAVLTDFEHMAEFVPNLESSQVLARTSKTLQVEQKGSISLGMLPIRYESKRQIDLTPYQVIRSRSLSGNTRLDSVMVLTPVGKETLLAYRATAVPDLPVPNSLVSSYMGEMLEHQFKAMGQEMLRRSKSGDAYDAEDELQLAEKPGKQTTQKSMQQTGKTSNNKPATPQTKPTPKKARTQKTKKQPG